MKTTHIRSYIRTYMHTYMTCIFHAIWRRGPRKRVIGCGGFSRGTMSVHTCLIEVVVEGYRMFITYAHAHINKECEM